MTELKSVVFGVNAGRISSRFGRTLPAAAGAGLVMVSAAYWIIAAPAHPSYLIGFLPGLLVGGVAIEVVILGTAARHSMGDFRRAWAAEIVAGALAAIAAAGSAGAPRRHAGQAGRHPCVRADESSARPRFAAPGASPCAGPVQSVSLRGAGGRKRR